MDKEEFIKKWTGINCEKADNEELQKELREDLEQLIEKEVQYAVDMTVHMASKMIGL